MRLEPTIIRDVLQIVPSRHEDSRGYFVEIYNKPDLLHLGIHVDFQQDNLSYSERQGTIRGLHFQIPPFSQSKLVRCSKGAILDVAVDIRLGSPTFGTHVAKVLSAENMHQLFIPPGFAHGFCTLCPATEVQYKVDAAYAPASERGVRYNNPALAIDWPLDDMPAVVSDRDKRLPPFEALQSNFRYADKIEVSQCTS
jgi:dTDP-4-dehydrorhamnose 3,5-epimerase